jgi:exodeoxyribonuclease V gamma subunit
MSGSMSGSERSPEPALYRSERVEDLLGPLVAWIDRTLPADPLAPVRVVVQSRGMQRWLSHQLAMRLGGADAGITATIDFPFPGRLLHDVAVACGIDADVDDPWAPDRLVSPICRELAAHPDEPLLAGMLRGADGDLADGVIGRRSWHLARDIADVFDRYALYRPDMVAAWVAGSDRGPDGRRLADADRWQPWMWRRLVADLGDPGERAARVRARLADPHPIDGLPVPVAFFGLTGLPPAHLEIVRALATRATVALFVPAPSSGRWGAALDTPSANPLLAACGSLADDAAALLGAAIAEYVAVEPDGGRVDAGAGTLLACVQADLREDRMPVPGAGELPADGTVQVHRCHGTSRQADALRDLIFGLLEDDPTLEPRDVVVLCPDVETFGPLVTAAFASDGRRPPLPVQVADRRARDADAPAEVLAALLAILESRMTASSVLDLFASETVARRHGLDPAAIARIGEWVVAVGVRWGIDDAHRETHGQPADRRNTWQAGLDRLLLGLVMADEDDRVVGDVTPFDDVEGDDADLVGVLAARCAALFAAADLARRPRPLAMWSVFARELVGDWVAVEDADRGRLHDLLALLDDLGSAGGDEPLTLGRVPFGARPPAR